jgi:hypothetical protein
MGVTGWSLAVLRQLPDQKDPQMFFFSSRHFSLEAAPWQLVYIRTGLLPLWETFFCSSAISILKPLQGEEPPSWTRYILLSSLIPSKLLGHLRD